MPVRSVNTDAVDVDFLRGSMYAGQFETMTFFSVSERSVARQSAGACLAPETPRSGSVGAARLTPAKATAPPPWSSPLRVSPVMRLLSRRQLDPSDRVTWTPSRQAKPSIRNTLATKSLVHTPRRPLTRLRRWGTITPMTRKPGRPATQLDDVSKAIIEQLQQDGRRSYAAIGKVVGLSEAAVRQRVQRLIESGVMQVVAVTDPLELGFARQAMIGIRARGSLEPIADEIAALDEVDYVVIAAGSFDILVEVIAESDEHLLEIVTKRIRAIPQVLSTETFVYLKLRKQTYSWGVR